MKMNFLLTMLLTCLFVGGYSTTTHAQNTNEKRERIQASYMIAFGRTPNSGELNYWMGQSDQNLSQLVANHKSYISRDAGSRRAAIIKSYNDAMGKNPTEAEISYWNKFGQTYTELMNNHIAWLNNNAEYENVIKRSYQFVLNRQPNSAEISYWKKQGVYSYVVLIGCHEQWKKSNGSQALKTSGSNSISNNSSLLTTVSLSNAVANEAARIIAAGGGNVVSAGGGNVIAAGGGNVVSAGGLNLIAAGGGNVVSAGGLN